MERTGRHPPGYAAQIATDLHELLQRGHVPGPYVLAGHSFGGLYVLDLRRPATRPRSPARRWWTPPHPRPRQRRFRPARDPDTFRNRFLALVSASTRIGLGRAHGWLAADGLPPQYDDQVRTRSASAASIRSTIDEYRQGGASRKQAASLTSFADKPLIGFTAGNYTTPPGRSAQDQLATLSTNSVHRIIAGANHASLVGERETSHRHHPSHPGRSRRSGTSGRCASE